MDDLFLDQGLADERRAPKATARFIGLEVCARIELRFGFDIEVSEPELEPAPRPSPLCPKCGDEMTYCFSTLPRRWSKRAGLPAG